MGAREDAEREAIGVNVRGTRQRLGISVRQLAVRLDVSASTMSAIERGRAPLDADRLHQLAKALGTTEPALRLGESVSVRDGHPQVRTTRPVADGQPRPLSSNDESAENDVKLGPPPWFAFDTLKVDAPMSAAISSFVEYGYHGVGMRAIAGRAGMSVPGIYHHYASKQELLVAILDLTMNDLHRRLDGALADAREKGSDPLARLALVVRVIALWHASRPDLAFIGASEMRSLEPLHSRRIARLRTRVQQRIDAEIAACANRGLVSVNDIAEAGRAISTMCTSICQWYNPAGPLTPEMVADDYTEYALRLVGAQCSKATKQGT